MTPSHSIRRAIKKALPPSTVLALSKLRARGRRAVPQEPLSFDEIGRALGIDQSSIRHNYLAKYQTNLEKFRTAACDIVLFSNNNPVATGKAFAQFFPSATVHLIWQGKSELSESGHFEKLRIHRFPHADALHAYLATLPNIQVMIDDGLNTKSSKLECFRDFFLHLKPGGVYVAEDLHASHLPERHDAEGNDVHQSIAELISHKALTHEQRQKHSSAELALGRSVEKMTSYGDIVFVQKAGTHAFKLADAAANAILEQRLGKSWGEIIATRPGGTHRSRSIARTNRSDIGVIFRKNIEHAALTARAYNEVVCSPGQIVYRREFVLPDTYRLAFRGDLTHRRLNQANAQFVPLTNTMLNPTKYLGGDFFYLDREWPAYGHVPTEVISRLWAWDAAKLKYPNLKALVSAPDTGHVLPKWEAELIQAYGIPAEDIVILTEPTRVERLVAATPMFEISSYIHPEITPIWKRIREGLVDPDFNSPERVFLSRKPGGVRDCRNAEELEKRFEDEGFLIVRPETLPLGQQLALLCNAKVVAGYAGSALLNAVFVDSPKTFITIGTDSFRNANEYLIASVTGGTFSYIFCTAEIQQPKGGWSQQAYHSPFSFDFEKDGSFLTDTFRALDAAE